MMGSSRSVALDPVIMSAVDPEDWSFISALERASRYANVSKAGDDVSYSRRVIMLGIAELVFSGSDQSVGWIGEWLDLVDPGLASALPKHDRSRAVSDALESIDQIRVSSRLADVIARARAIARDTSRRDTINLRHYLFALTENPGRAFVSFNRHPSKDEIAELRRIIVDSVLRAPGKDDPGAWMALLPPAADDEPPVGGGLGDPAGTSSPPREKKARPGAKTGPEQQDPGQQKQQQQGSGGQGLDHGAGPATGEDKTETKPAPIPGAEPAGGEAPPLEDYIDENKTDFVDDDAELDQDRLERSVLAIGLARKLHSIWRRTNDPSGKVPGNVAASPAPAFDQRAAHEGSRAAFVLHLDAPWGGGKTTFANFLARVLNPCPDGAGAAGFLRERYGDNADLGGIFIADPPPTKAEGERLKREFSEDSRRRWITVYFNAWQMEHIKPPWWAFYQAIRQACFEAIRREGDEPWDPVRKPGFGAWFPRLKKMGDWIDRFDRWLGLWSEEVAWRFTNPKIYSLLITAVVSLLLVGLLYWTGAWGVIQTKDGSKGSFLLGSPLGLILTGVGGITGLWWLSALVTESIVPGTDTLAERLNLGSGDPFGRFRRHFAYTMRRLRRPVLVVVDDLDRCQPAFVVDLIRGIQTLLRSPRVVFVILGDREWIERAFESQHESMSKLDVGPEQTFGARFVEKAIQMSFVLPALGAEARIHYVRHVVLGDRAKAGRPRVPALEQGVSARIREFVNRQAAKKNVDTFDTKSVLNRVGERLWADQVASDDERSIGSVLEEAGVEKGSAALEQIVSETLAIHAATDAEAEKEVRHELERFARYFPANPRQIKRIVNSITIYYAVAIQRPDVPTDPRFCSQLAMWIILMTEWPQTWRLLASYPDLVTILTASDRSKALRSYGLMLPGSVKATEGALAPIVADRELMALITGTGSDPPHEPLDAKEVYKLVELTPLHSRVRRLAEPQAAARSVRRQATMRAAPVPAEAD